MPYFYTGMVYVSKGVIYITSLMYPGILIFIFDRSELKCLTSENDYCKEWLCHLAWDSHIFTKHTIRDNKGQNIIVW